MMELVGRTLGHYRIVEKIGAGGMGVVFKARDERLDRDVAVKVLPEEVAGDAGRLRRFEREAKAVAALSHPNILEIFDFGSEGGITYAVTELLEGETLSERLRREAGPLPSRRALEIGAAAAGGLVAAHARGVVHRDIKPSNIFLCADGRVKIITTSSGMAAPSLRIRFRILILTSPLKIGRWAAFAGHGSRAWYYNCSSPGVLVTGFKRSGQASTPYSRSEERR